MGSWFARRKTLPHPQTQPAMKTGVYLPPTPPARSCASIVEPVTPTELHSPPTPDVTPPKGAMHRREVLQDALVAGSSNATKAVRQILDEPERAPCHGRQRGRQQRASGTSVDSHVVEVFLVDGPPRRQKTLRHVRKQSLLRDPRMSADLLASTLSDCHTRHESASVLSTTTSRSISSSRARREIWRSGAIPVVVVPERRSSRGPAAEPSLRSTSSRRSAESGPPFSRRRSRRYSESDRDASMDFPPAVPARSSSLSAPTSRNVSPPLKTHSPPIVIPAVRGSPHRPLEDVHGEALSPKVSLKTPFSVISMETCATAPELSEALAVHMFLHQNSSILVVNSGPPPHKGHAEPSTPPPQELHDADSPLCNPRVPPAPPVHILPATPDAPQKSLVERGNLVKRALSRRREQAAPGLVTRTSSLSRSTPQSSDEPRDKTQGLRRSLSAAATPRRTRSVRERMARSQSVGGKRRFSLGATLEEIQSIPQLLRERRRDKRSQKLRVMISGPREVRDGVGDVIRKGVII